MSLELQQFDDNTAAFVNPADAVKDLHIGGPTSPTPDAPRYQVTRVAKMALTAGTDTAGALGAWQNNTGDDVIVSRLEIDVTTIATAACTVNAGQTSSSATTSADNLIDGLDVHTGTGIFDNINDQGTDGKSRQKVAVGDWVTFSTASGASAGLVANAYLHYHPA